MPIEIKLPNTKITCPTIETSLIILQELGIIRNVQKKNKKKEKKGKTFYSEVVKEDPSEESLDYVMVAEPYSERTIRVPIVSVSSDSLNTTASSKEVEVVSETKSPSEEFPPAKEFTLSSLRRSFSDRTNKILKFVSEKDFFNFEDVNKFAQENLELTGSKKDRQRLRESLRTIEKSGVITKTARGEWKKVL